MLSKRRDQAGDRGKVPYADKLVLSEVADVADLVFAAYRHGHGGFTRSPALAMRFDVLELLVSAITHQDTRLRVVPIVRVATEVGTNRWIRAKAMHPQRPRLIQSDPDTRKWINDDSGRWRRVEKFLPAFAAPPTYPRLPDNGLPEHPALTEARSVTSSRHHQRVEPSLHEVLAEQRFGMPRQLADLAMYPPSQLRHVAVRLVLEDLVQTVIEADLSKANGDRLAYLQDLVRPGIGRGYARDAVLAALKRGLELRSTDPAIGVPPEAVRKVVTSSASSLRMCGRHAVYHVMESGESLSVPSLGIALAGP